MSRAATYIIVCEDRTHKTFVGAFLRSKYGWSIREEKRLTDYSRFPKDGSRGAGEKHVRDAYPAELQAFRANKNCKMLIVVIDADTRTVEARHNQLDDAARAGNVGGPRKRDEPVLHIIPKRSIETWLRHLQGEQVNETDSYKQRFKGDVNEMATKLLKDCGRVLKSGEPDSLRRAATELHRMSMTR